VVGVYEGRRRTNTWPVIQLAESLNKNMAMAAISSTQLISPLPSLNQDTRNVPPSPHRPSGIASLFRSPFGESLAMPSVPEIGRGFRQGEGKYLGKNGAREGLIWRNDVASDASRAFFDR
jgi:hypothetical protein